MTELVRLARNPDGQAHLLAGLGGVGKSTVALAVGECLREDGIPVWWTSAVGGSSLAESLLLLAADVGADPDAVTMARAGRRDPADVLWGRLERHAPWMLVIDNADDVAALAIGDRPAGDGNGWVRGSHSGLVLVTSRDCDPARWGGRVTVHRVESLSRADGARVLLDLAPEAGTREEALALSERLGGLPLALRIVGRQLACPHSTDGGFAGYLVVMGSGGTSAQEVVMRTWELSLRHLDGLGVPQARGLLNVLAWFAGATPIPAGGLAEEVLRRACGGDVREGLEALRSASLIDADRRGTVVHPLLTETIRLRLGARPGSAGPAGRLARALRRVDPRRSAEAAVELLVAAAPELDPLDPAGWAVWNAWLPHLESLLTTAAAHVGRAALADLASAAADASRTFVCAGAYDVARRVTETGGSPLRRLRTRHPATIRLRNAYATACVFAGRLEEALDLFPGLLDTARAALGRDHPDTLAVQHEFARALAHRREFARAEPMFTEVILLRTRTLGPYHRDTLTSGHEYGFALAQQGKFAEAERRLREVLALKEQVLDPDHHDMLAAHHELARTLTAQGRTAEAERMSGAVWRAAKRTLGENHPDTLVVLHEYANTIAAQGRTAEATDLCRDVLRARTRILGDTHPYTRNSERLLRELTG